MISKYNNKQRGMDRMSEVGDYMRRV